MKEILYRALIRATNGPVFSSIVSRFARSSLSQPFIKPYAKVFRINQNEMDGSWNSYPNLHTFFTRRLKAGIRPIDNQYDTVISPVDGVIEDIGKVDLSQDIMVKGKKYSIAEMLGGKEQAKEFVEGIYMIIYLSPSHYHRIHSPLAGKKINQYSLGNRSFPVNALGLKYGKATLATNYRIITILQHEKMRLAMVKVGAMMINSVQVINQNDTWKKGEEVAYFSFGSTVIMLFPQAAFEPKLQALPTPVKYGEPIGKIKTKRP
ncbi:phosphatidylserine decarboxylase [Lederbergia galactosidilyticus]|uniref:phosphatidylserine decarboxylase n=1 Tax=Lederbergia galactosidilytica TaxID=217031 RepID=UPI001AE2E828|nr:phosphatidylserine decarboxylase [Lederbergia galactosidilytica]MBP1914856.1 phosphatidylserine decarboxylase [Lederbergia galactosidilytica]